MASQDLEDKLEQLRTKLIDSKAIDFAKYDDELLAKFLMACDLDLTMATALITEYFSTRKKHPEIFLPLRYYLERFNTQLYYLLPKNDHCNHDDIIFVRPANWNPDENDIKTAIGHVVPYFELIGFDDRSRTDGFTLVVDMRGVTIGHLKYLKPSVIKFGVMIYERIMPIKFRRIEILFETQLVRTMYGLIKPFLSDEIKKAIRFWGKDMTEFLSLYPLDRLPETIGGKWVLTKFTEAQICEMDNLLNRHWNKYSV